MPFRLPCMMMQLQRCNLKGTYKKGKEMLLEDILSCALLTDDQPETRVMALSGIYHHVILLVQASLWMQIGHASSNDSLCTQPSVCTTGAGSTMDAGKVSNESSNDSISIQPSVCTTGTGSTMDAGKPCVIQ